MGDRPRRGPVAGLRAGADLGGRTPRTALKSSMKVSITASSSPIRSARTPGSKIEGAGEAADGAHRADRDSRSRHAAAIGRASARGCRARSACSCRRPCPLPGSDPLPARRRVGGQRDDRDATGFALLAADLTRERIAVERGMWRSVSISPKSLAPHLERRSPSRPHRGEAEHPELREDHLLVDLSSSATRISRCARVPYAGSACVRSVPANAAPGRPASRSRPRPRRPSRSFAEHEPALAGRRSHDVVARLAMLSLPDDHQQQMERRAQRIDLAESCGHRGHR